MRRQNIRYVWFFHNITNKPTKHSISLYKGVAIYNYNTGQIVTRYGPWFDNPAYDRHFYDSKANLLKSQQTLRRGSIVRHRGDGLSYVIEAIDKDRAIGVRTVEITNPSEWEVVGEKS